MLYSLYHCNPLIDVCTDSINVVGPRHSSVYNYTQVLKLYRPLICEKVPDLFLQGLLIKLQYNDQTTVLLNTFNLVEILATTLARSRSRFYFLLYLAIKKLYRQSN